MSEGAVSEGLILNRKDRDKLGERHDQFRRGEIISFACVVVKADGTTEVDFDVVDARGPKEFNKLGGGMLQALEHLRNFALEAQIAANIQRGQNPFATN